VRSIFQHVRCLYHPLRNSREWTVEDDAKLAEIIKDHGRDWGKVRDTLERPPTQCKNRYEKCVEHKGTRRRGIEAYCVSGKWSSAEESRITQIIEEIGEEGTSSQTSGIPWTEVAKRMDHTRTANQCRDKWVDALAPRLQNDGKKRRWSYADTRILVDKIASLDLDGEEDIIWTTLPDSTWTYWTPHRLQHRWRQLKKPVTSEGATHRGR
ncbi:hypothetical protein BGW80DRAFT_1185410, partial [Lactifluus volemus]